MAIDISYDPAEKGDDLHEVEVALGLHDNNEEDEGVEEEVEDKGLCHRLFCLPYPNHEDLGTDCLCIDCEINGYSPCLCADAFSNPEMLYTDWRRADQVWLMFCCGRAATKGRRSITALCGPCWFVAYICIALAEIIFILIAFFFAVVTFPVWLVILILWCLLSDE